MKVNTFVKKVKEGQFNNAADMIKVWYIPIQTKHDIALRTLEKCSADNNGYFYVDDFEKNIYILRRDQDFVSNVIKYSDFVDRNDIKKSEVLLSNYIEGTSPNYERINTVKELLCKLVNI